MICVIRIHGMVGLNKKIAETLNRLRLRRKYSCIVLEPTKEEMGMIKKLRDVVAFGEINKSTLEKLIEKRGKWNFPVNPEKSEQKGKLTDKSKKIDAKKIAEGLMDKKSYWALDLKPFFRLHPPRGGIKSKIHFPKGVLGDNKKKINELVMRMI